MNVNVNANVNNNNQCESDIIIIMMMMIIMIMMMMIMMIILVKIVPREEAGGNLTLVRNIIAQQIALNKTITQNNLNHFLKKS